MNSGRWQDINARYDALQVREKRLIFFGSLVLSGYLILILWLEPLWQSYQQSVQRTTQLQQQLTALQQQNALLIAELEIDINQPLREQLAQQLALNTEQAAGLASLQTRFITGSQTIALLRDMLARIKTVQLVTLSTSAAEPIFLAGQQTNETPALYQHKTQLVVQGRYEELQQLVQALEQLPWLLSWQQLDYQVQQHPLAQLTLQIATVSEHESYIQF